MSSFLCATVLLSSCTVRLGAIYTAPNVLLAKSTHTLALRLAPEVKDAFETDVSAPPTTMAVTQWRTTLAAAFQRGYAKYFAAPPASGKADFTLVVLRADPALAIADRGLERGQVRFQAELIDANGRVLKTWGDTAIARNTGMINSDRDMAATVGSAVEAMYEEIANGMPHLD